MSVKNNTSKKNARPAAKLGRLKKHIAKSQWLIFVPFVVLIAALSYFQAEYEPPAPLAPPPTDALYKQADQPVEKRVADLLSRMTIEEKIGQMAMVDKNNVTKLEDVSRYNLGAVLSGAGAKPANNTAAGWLEMVSRLKNEAKKSRLGIPIFFGVDATHGHANVPGATVFPHAIGLGASGDPELVRAVAEATSKELAATGINWNFAPMLDAPQDIRWGRTYEAFSSDPALNAQLGAAHVQGTQAIAENKSYVLASAKHFLGVGSMTWGESNNKNFKIDQGKIPENNDLLNSQYIVPFAAAVDAGVSTVMVGLSEYGDDRIIDNKALVTGKLKGELGFNGFVVSDWYGVYEFSGVSSYRANVKTINAGTDMAMLPYEYKGFIKNVRKAVKHGDISEDRINDAVSRILTQKFKTGLFENQESPNLAEVGSKNHRELARKAVASSAVLLKNNDNLLPLSKNTERVLIAGSGADNIGRQSGAWTVEWQGIDGNWLPGATSILSGIKDVAASGRKIEYDLEANFSNIQTKAPVGIAIVSEKPYAEGWGDNEYPTLAKADIEVIERLRTKAEKVIIITITGRPLFMTEQIAQADAVIAAWLPGSEGAGLADVLFGEVPFSGKLPLAWPTSVEQLPITSNNKSKNGTNPIFPRGFGL